MWATVPNVGIRDTEMGKKWVLLPSVFTLSGKTHSIQISISVRVWWVCYWGCAKYITISDEETVDSAFVIGGPGRLHLFRSWRLEKCKSKLYWCTTSHQSEWPLLKSLQIANAGEGMEKQESSYTVGGSVNLCIVENSMEGPQKTKNYHMIQQPHT